MERGFQLAENERHRFGAPVEVRWRDSHSQPCAVSGESVDVSVYGLGIVVPVPLPLGTEVTVWLHGRETCGSAQVRHVQPCPSGFRVGLHFELTLFMQEIPGLDDVLRPSLRCTHETKKAWPLSLLQRMVLRLARVALPKPDKPEISLPTATHSSSARFSR